REPLQRIANRRRTNPDPLTDYPRRQPCQAQTQNLAHMAHRNPPRRHPFLQSLNNRKNGPTIRILHLENCARSHRNAARIILGTPRAIISERCARSNRNAARDHIGIRMRDAHAFQRTARTAIPATSRKLVAGPRVEPRVAPPCLRGPQPPHKENEAITGLQEKAYVPGHSAWG